MNHSSLVSVLDCQTDASEDSDTFFSALALCPAVEVIPFDMLHREPRAWLAGSVRVRTGSIERSNVGMGKVRQDLSLELEALE